jgi:uncharacterized protein YjbI with pentapeptide repeats
MVEEKGRQTADKKEGRKPWTLREFGGQTLWDWLHLLSALAIPVVLAAAGLWFTDQQDQRQVAIENQRAEAERELAEQRAQDEALQAYLNQMSQLMLERKLLEVEPGTPLYTLAQARTSTVILRLDAEHNESVARFLINSGLAASIEGSPRLLREITLSHATLSDAYLPNADLSSADLSGADLPNADLSYADLGDANLRNADLSGADLGSANLSVADLPNAELSYADLSYANLNGANLNGASLNGADLTYANLSDGFFGKKIKLRGGGFYLRRRVANLSGANLSGAELDFANLRNADLSGADLSGADLIFADLHDADLRKADLHGASALTDEKIAAAESLEGATMPNGQKYEDWQDE